MNKISLVINTLNEEANIADCINSVGDLADEVIVCDMYSDDNTVGIAKKLNAVVVFHKRTGFVEPARFFAISQATRDWVLVLDADERMTDALSAKLKEIAREGRYDLVSFCWLFEYFGDFLKDGTFYKNRVPRFFRKKNYLENYVKEEEEIHQNFRSLEKNTINKIELPPEYYLIHHAYPTIEKYVTKTLGMYARIEAEEMHKKGIGFSHKQLILDPLKSFIRNYIRHCGYKGGTRGFIKHFLYSVYRFNVWANIWFLEQKNIQESNIK
jgi:glycosyltransferase involved in cell wall biosynthesis